MYFTLWLLKRMKKTFVGNERWEWVDRYRQCIMHEKGLSIVITTLVGTLWFLISTLIAVWVTPRPPDYVLVSILITPVVFYIYHWIMALHEVYKEEKLECWNELKR